MKTSQPGLDLIKKFEGYRSDAYQDSVGVWTIGYGHTKGVTPGMKIDRVKAEEYLKSDVKHVEDKLNSQNLRLNQNQFDALVSLFFNVGTGHLTKFIPDLKSDPDSAKVPDRMLKYVYAGGQVLSGLVRRREAEVQLYKKKVTM